MPENTLEDELAALKANIDQDLMPAPEVARIAFTYYTAFLNAGFNESQALALTMNQIDG